LSGISDSCPMKDDGGSTHAICAKRNPQIALLC